MPHSTFFDSPDGFLAQFAGLTAELYREANAARWGLSQRAFAEALGRSASKKFGGAQAPPDVMEAYLRSLHLEDLALACACSAGLEDAWEFFVAHFRRDLRTAARAMLRASGPTQDARADELADSVYAELYGVHSHKAGKRKSLFEYFHGRSKLSTWLRAVLAQKHIDMIRTGTRIVSLDAEEEGRSAGAREKTGRPGDSALDPYRERYLKRFDLAFSAALASLAPRERMILACYYADQMTLAEIGKIVREHESTISRQLERTRRTLRESVITSLKQNLLSRNGNAPEPGLDDAQVDLVFEYALEDWPFDLSRALSAEKPRAERERNDA